MAVAYTILSQIQQAMSFIVCNIETPEGSMWVIRLLDRTVYTASAYLKVRTTEFDM